MDRGLAPTMATDVIGLLPDPEEAAGASFAGPSGTKDTYVILESKGTASSPKMRNENGRETLVKP